MVDNAPPKACNGLVGAGAGFRCKCTEQKGKEAMSYRVALLAGVVALAGMNAGALGVVTVRLVPSDLSVELGEVFSIAIVADIPDAVVAWGLDLITEDETVLSPVGDSLIGPLWIAGYAPDGDGLAGLAYPSSVVGNDILLATVTFSADALGETELLLSDDNPPPHVSPPSDLTEGFGLDPTGFADVTYEPGHVEVVPEPATLILLAFGGLFALRKRTCRCSATTRVMDKVS